MYSTFLTKTATGETVAATGPELPNSGDRKKSHYLEDIYDPDTVSDTDASKYVVPREGELVFDPPNKRTYLVTHVAGEDAKYKSTLTLIDMNAGGQSDDSDSSIIGAPAGFQGEAVLGIDYSVRPPRAQVDSRVWKADAAYALLYKGVVIGSSGQVISAQYGTNGDLISSQVPVKLAAVNNMTNHAIMTTTAFSVNQNADELPDGSVCTLVFYDAAGNPIPSAVTLGVQHTALLRDHQIGIKYVSSVELVAPWFTDATDPYTLNVPINVAIPTIEFYMNVHYSDGTVKQQLIDGTKAYLVGLNEYKPTTVGQFSNIVAVYSFDEGEQAVLSDPGSPNQKRQKYKVVCTQVNGAYSPKLFTYPVADGDEFTMRHWLCDLTRSFVTDVTSHVTLNDTSPAFKPSTFGVEQNMVFNLRLNDVSPEYSAWPLVQHTTLVLYKPASGVGKRWDVRYSNGATPYTALNVSSVTTDDKQVINLAGGYTTISDWLNRLYYPVEPLMDTTKESAVPVPNMFRLVDTAGNKQVISINDWNKDVTLTAAITSGQTLFIQWIKQADNGSQLQLGVTGVVVDTNPQN